jgi:hypothetical protein
VLGLLQFRDELLSKSRFNEAELATDSSSETVIV